MLDCGSIEDGGGGGGHKFWLGSLCCVVDTSLLQNPVVLPVELLDKILEANVQCTEQPFQGGIATCLVVSCFLHFN